MKKKDSDIIKIKIPKIPKDITNQLRRNPWIVSTFVFGILSLVLIINSFFGGSFSITVASPNFVGDKLVNFLNANSDSEVTLNDISLENGLYKVNINYQGSIIPLYITTDGNFLIQDLVPIDSISGVGSSNSRNNFVSASEDDDPFLGDEDAPVTIIEFSDYQCPFCKRFWSETLPLIKSEYIDTGKVKLVYRDFPLTRIHSQAQGAAEAAECVRKQGGDGAYFEYHDKLFENQQLLSDSNFKLWATELGYNIDECLDSGEFTSEVLKDIADAQTAGGSGTPYFVVNGVPLSGAQPFSAFQQIIEAELA